MKVRHTVALGIFVGAATVLTGCAANSPEILSVVNGNTIVAGDQAGMTAYQRDPNDIVVRGQSQQARVQPPQTLPPAVNEWPIFFNGAPR